MRESTRAHLTGFFGLVLILYALMVGTHWYWLTYPGQISHVLKVIAWIAWMVLFLPITWWRTLSLKFLTIGVLIGGGLNILVVTSNGGFMPVIGKTGASEGPWVEAVPSHHLLWLADRVDWYGLSPGDILLFGTPLLLATVYLLGAVLKRMHSSLRRFLCQIPNS